MRQSSKSTIVLADMVLFTLNENSFKFKTDS